MAAATTSLPTPVSPISSTAIVPGAMRSTSSNSFCIATDSTTRFPWGGSGEGSCLLDWSARMCWLAMITSRTAEFPSRPGRSRVAALAIWWTTREALPMSIATPGGTSSSPPDGTRRPSMRVPLALPMSVRKTAPSRIVSTAWLRETDGLTRMISLSSARPIRSSPDSGIGIILDFFSSTTVSQRSVFRLDSSRSSINVLGKGFPLLSEFACDESRAIHPNHMS
jgi:hypothetical protein